jgi:transcriptional antiterminator RfaH
MTWLLAQTKHNAMNLAINNLHRQGFVTFVPLERKTQRRQKKLLQIKAPYFGNYLFVSTEDSSAPISCIKSTYGVTRLVESGGAIAEVPQQLIDELKDRCDKEGCIVRPTSAQIGDAVRMTGGPFHDQLGQIEELATNDRVWVLIHMLGGQNKALVKLSGLTRV